MIISYSTAIHPAFDDRRPGGKSMLFIQPSGRGGASYINSSGERHGPELPDLLGGTDWLFFAAWKGREHLRKFFPRRRGLSILLLGGDQLFIHRITQIK